MNAQAFLQLPQIVRFLLLGGLAAAVNWLVRFPLSGFMPFPAAVFVAYLIGMSAGFALYRTFVFPNSSQPVALQAILFLVVNVVGAAVVMGVSIWLVASVLPMLNMRFFPEAIAHGTAIGIGAVVNFVGHKYLSFRVAAVREAHRAT